MRKIFKVVKDLLYALDRGLKTFSFPLYFGMMFGGMGIIILIFALNVKKHDITPCSYTTHVEVSHVEETPLRSLEDEIYSTIFQLRIEHPEIVFAQCILESGRFSSQLFLKGNNCLGMMLSKVRPSVAIGVYLGHAQYEHWRDCLIDYALWQTAYARGLSSDEYLKYLDKVYAEDSLYSKKLRYIMRMRKSEKESLFIDESALSF